MEERRKLYRRIIFRLVKTQALYMTNHLYDEELIGIIQAIKMKSMYLNIILKNVICFMSVFFTSYYKGLDFVFC